MSLRLLETPEKCEIRQLLQSLQNDNKPQKILHSSCPPDDILSAFGTDARSQTIPGGEEILVLCLKLKQIKSCSLASFTDKVSVSTLEDPGWRDHLFEAHLI